MKRKRRQERQEFMRNFMKTNYGIKNLRYYARMAWDKKCKAERNIPVVWP